jgi:hypothetical protein
MRPRSSSLCALAVLAVCAIGSTSHAWFPTVCYGLDEQLCCQAQYAWTIRVITCNGQPCNPTIVDNDTINKLKTVESGHTLDSFSATGPQGECRVYVALCDNTENPPVCTQDTQLSGGTCGNEELKSSGTTACTVDP